MSQSVMISAGEASGDLHAAKLVHALRQRQPGVQVTGMGGEQLKAAGAELLVDCRELAVMGLVEVLKQWRQIQAALQTLQAAIAQQPPDLLILVDYVEFNLKLAGYAKQRGIKVLFYVSPQVWAWRAGRVPKIGRAIDMMAVIFPFEQAIYEQHHVPVRFVGHPLADEVSPGMDKAAAQQHFGLDPARKTVGLLPGSRQSEVERILPTLLQSARLIQDTLGEVQFILPVAPTIDRDAVQRLVDKENLSLQLLDEQTYAAINCCDAAMVASGTATLEVALLETPMSIVYKVNPLSYFILSRMIQIEHIGLVNIVAGRAVVPEFVQAQANPYLIAAEVVKQLTDQTYRQQIIGDLQDVKQRLGAGGTADNVAALACEMLSGSI